jgi:hypothetical protein
VQSLLEVDLTFFQVEGDIDLIVKNVTGATVGSSSSTTDNESVSIPSLPAGTYYVIAVLYSDTGVVPGNDYSMDVQFTP